jgi:hypothetical protein
MQLKTKLWHPSSIGIHEFEVTGIRETELGEIYYLKNTHSLGTHQYLLRIQKSFQMILH